MLAECGQGCLTYCLQIACQKSTEVKRSTGHSSAGFSIAKVVPEIVKGEPKHSSIHVKAIFVRLSLGGTQFWQGAVADELKEKPLAQACTKAWADTNALSHACVSVR